ncbi:MAG: hypothetical protein IBJ11_02720 [Phycisphaerales bacterium]|nr:hypothetical protein [Phycisphaerales bacterium]
MIDLLRNKSLAVLVGAFFAPSAAVAVAGFLFSGGPAEAPAAPADAQPAATPASIPVAGPSAVKLTPEQNRLKDWLAHRPPMAETLRAPVAVPPKPPEPPPPPPKPTPEVQSPSTPAQPDAPPRMELTAVMGRTQAPVATINGRLHSVGQAVSKGWKVRSIDLNTRTVVVEHTDGRTVELTIAASPRGE